MKKFLIVLGSIFLALIVLGALGIGFVAMRGTALDKESKAYADAAIPAITTTWLDKALLDRASSEFNQATTPLQVYHLFRQWENSLGRLQKCEPAQGQSLVSVTTQNGKQITAKYTAKAQFEKGEATITLVLIKHGDQWQIGGFHVDSPQVVAPFKTI
jgi:UDP-N-acetylmuramyl tripeptide synthase